MLGGIQPVARELMTVQGIRWAEGHRRHASSSREQVEVPQLDASHLKTAGGWSGTVHRRVLLFAHTSLDAAHLKVLTLSAVAPSPTHPGVQARRPQPVTCAGPQPTSQQQQGQGQGQGQGAWSRLTPAPQRHPTLAPRPSQQQE
jgi:hypothetical protein